MVGRTLGVADAEIRQTGDGAGEYFLIMYRHKISNAEVREA